MTVWRKSTYSAGADCLEAALDGETILVRNSNDPDKVTLQFTASEWFAFIEGAKVGEFDDL